MPRTPSQSEERRKAHRKRLSLGTGVGKVEQSIRRLSERNVNGELRVPRVEVVGLAERSVNGISKTNEGDSVPTGDCLGGRPGSDQPSTGLASQDPVLELQSIFQETFGWTSTNHQGRQCAITPFPLPTPARSLNTKEDVSEEGMVATELGISEECEDQVLCQPQCEDGTLGLLRLESQQYQWIEYYQKGDPK
ncbi:hypothetical protein FA13DRAFT_1718547 [Coprinellus micaceus]|uniref:Uncharacterized protein n=1 Tax=Coprinellus micaceus TaxID=71717 RepID=A0A4Y7SDQ8_COPMI|nr:hypothetical protein FA13DRAFT_1718547 [Coprinellus micaceus]